MPKKSRRIPKSVKELALAEYISEFFARESLFPSNEEIVERLRSQFPEEEVGPLYPKDITNLKKGAYQLLDVGVALPRSSGLEDELRDALGLDSAVVVGAEHRTYDSADLRSMIGLEAARFFDQNVRDGETVTFSCSVTIREMIKRIRQHYTNLRVMADCVVAVREFHVMSPVTQVVLFLDRYPDCRGVSYAGTLSLVDLMGRPRVQEILDRAIFHEAFAAHWMFVGVGTLAAEFSNRGIIPGFDYLTHVVTQDAEALHRRGVVGEISYWPVNGYGEPVFRGDSETISYFNHVFTHSRFGELDRTHRRSGASRTKVVAAAGGPNKVAAIRAVSRYLDVLVTDVRTARELLRLS
jgi:DNA-binding transcriptional regulator LsrR (DeoR family)